MPTSRTFDLSTGEPWYGLRPGMSRAEVTRILEAEGAEASYDEDRPDRMMADGAEWCLELRLSESGEQRVRQLTLDDWNFVWRGQDISNRPLHEVLAVLGDTARDAMWRPEDAAVSAFEDLQPLGAESVEDESLLDTGTLWLRQLGIGLVLCSGKVNEVVWRPLEDVPTQFAGPVTDAQKQLSANPDVEAKIREKWVKRAPVTSTPPNPLQRIVTLLHVAAFITLGYLAFRHAQHWHQAPTVTGKLASIDKATKKPWIDFYVIEYQDAAGQTRSARLRSGEFYVPPQKIGEETQIFYLDGNPPRAKGPAHARDAAFIDFVPWFIIAGASYLVLWVIADFVWRMRRASAPPVVPASPSAPPPPFMPDRGK